MYVTKPKWLVFILTLVLFGFFIMAVGCGEEEATTTTAPGQTGTTGAAELARDQTLRVNIATEPPTLDPNLATDATSMYVISNVFEPLLQLDGKANVFPGAAERYEVSADGLVYTFYLRGTDKWSNGDPVTADDFKASWLRILDPKTAAGYAYQLFFIKGAEEFNSGKGKAEDVAIDATDPKKLVVTLKAPTPWFPTLMAHTAYFPIPRKTVDQLGDGWTEPGSIVSNGPYKLTAWNHNSDLLLTKNPDWRDAKTVVLEKIKMVMITESTTGVAAFENGEIDIQMDVPTADIDRIKKLPEYKVFPVLGVYYIGFNVKHPPLDKVDVRRALALAIDRQFIVDNVTKSGQKPATGFAPEGLPGFDQIKKDFLKPTADVEQAKQLLAQTGFPNGQGLPPITIYFNKEGGHQAIVTAIQEQWKKIGVQSILKNMEWKQYLDFVQNNDEVMAFRNTWIADFPDAYNFFDVLRTGGGNNYTRWGSAVVDSSLDGALQAASDEDRWKIYADMEEAISVKEMPVAPIYWYTNPELVKEYVDGYEPSPMDTINFWTVKILKH